MSYKGKYKPINKDRYHGDITNVIYRSLWERQLMKWLDNHNNVNWWTSEETVIPYISPIDNKIHRYFVDFTVSFNNGEIKLIEVKPSARLKKPTMKKRTRRTIIENIEYAKNSAKFEAAHSYAINKGWKFEVWTEHTLRSLGIMILEK